MLEPISLAVALIALTPGTASAEESRAGLCVEARLDASLTELSVTYLASGREELLSEMAATPAAAHLLAHARAWEYEVPRESTSALVRFLVTPVEEKKGRVAAATKALAYFEGPLREDTSWIAELRRTLPPEAATAVDLFLTFGYDIGVATPGNASLNAVHPHFEADPAELRYYAIHECHHAVFMHYQPPRPLVEWQSVADLLAQSEYALQLEGMAVWAAWELREREGALDGDEDYRALRDEGQIRKLEARFLEVHRALEACAGEPGAADEATRELLLGLYGPDRIFYRFGGYAAREIERLQGRPALLALVETGPRSFWEAYLRAKGEPL